MIDATAGPAPHILVTGGTGGIGYATAKALARAGASVVVTGRGEARGRQAAARITAETGNGDVSSLAADLATRDGTRKLAEQVTATGRPLDVLVNNVGGLYAQRRVTEDGREATMAVNYLNPLLLSHLLLPALASSAAPAKRPRVVFVSSGAIRFAKPSPDDPDSERSYRGLDVYGRAKLLGALAALEFARRQPEIDVFAVDPGSAATEMTAAMVPSMMPAPMRVFWPVFRLVQRRQTAERAAVSTVAAATDPALAGRSGAWLDRRGRQRTPRQLQDRAAAVRAYEQAVAELGLTGSGTAPSTGAAT